ncbi:Na(+)/H(+) antiporter subunit B [Clostridium thermarum]|uniref:Na(+)/H(+) antiporter subunit B n=1 Tax=Clostridium thermarum TaxID=1716543 RepID=UPI0013D58EAD|nr:hydrogenase subunit MbhD domain-containing protein [Clostridium thermarum]
MSSMDILNTLIMIGIIVAGLITVIVDDLLPCIIASSVLGTFIAIEFLLLRAPDVAIAEGAVGAVLSPIIFIITLKKVQGKAKSLPEKQIV